MATIPFAFWKSSSSPFVNTQSVNFAGTSGSYVNCGTSFGQYQATDTFTIALWVNAASSASQLWFGNYNGTYGYALGYVTDLGLYFQIGNFPSAYLATTFVNANWGSGAWHHVAVVYYGTGNNSDLYIDGLLSTASNSGTWSAFTPYADSLFLGNGGTPGIGEFFFNGNLNQVSFYNIALNQTAVTALYNGGTPASQSGLPGLTQWFRMVGPLDSTSSLYDYVSNTALGTGTDITFQSNVP